MTTYKTPGVYVEEISTLPHSVAEVETAIPAFIGFTEKGLPNVPKRITSMLDYQANFGGAEPEKGISVTVQGDKVEAVTIDQAKKSKNVLYYAMQLFYNNGGGPCYIVPAGNFADAANASVEGYTAGLTALEKEDEPTLLVFPDAPLYLQPDQYYALMNAALLQCEKLGDRFAIIDVVDQSDAKTAKDSFRNNISANLSQAKYGAAYFPSLRTTLSYVYDAESISVNVAADPEVAQKLADATQAAETARKDANDAKAEAERLKAAADAAAGDENAKKASDRAARRASDTDQRAQAAERARTDAEGAMKKQTFKDLSNGLQNQVKQHILNLPVILTPCAAVAGVYASVDGDRGVWKAPANVSLNSVTGPVTKITDEDQKDLNVDVNAGKSINAIRAFAGKGTIVWGARTLAGNDNEWRYVNVRRFFNMVEESVKKASNAYVFEPNDANTWLNVKAMIENYLMLKWRQGALAGAKPEDSFFVRVGLGQTMTADDVLNGILNIEIGMAVVRPAEFIILKFSHKLQTS